MLGKSNLERNYFLTQVLEDYYELLERGWWIWFQHVIREGNMMVDNLANLGVVNLSRPMRLEISSMYLKSLGATSYCPMDFETIGALTLTDLRPRLPSVNDFLTNHTSAFPECTARENTSTGLAPDLRWSA
ncbi:hypothetical protein Sjap_013633 [Stephania japonica]|uniref:Uncharacterized protein n=1 Tax=Stephania japonica TaxID=461633 RepID=A0AAP0P1H8_9MAGN